MKRLTEYIYYSNVWIAIGAIALMWLTIYSFDLAGEFRPITAMVFFSTLLSYSLHRLYPVLVGSRDPNENAHLTWIWSHRIEGIAVLMISAFASAFLFLFFISRSAQLLMVLAGLITLLYSIPVFNQRSEGPKIRLRDFAFVKIFLIAKIWVISCVLLPWIESERTVSILPILLSIIEKACFLIAITIPFDIRDYVYDKMVEVNTIPQAIGFKKSVNLAMALCGIAVVLLWLNYFLFSAFTNMSVVIGLSIAYLITAFIISKTTAYRGDWFYLGALDGTFVLHFILVFIFIT